MFSEQHEDNLKYSREKEKKRLELKKKLPNPVKYEYKKNISKIISFNVGGKIFNCYLFTLLKFDSFLRIIFSNQIENTNSLKDSNEMIFLDRPSKPFEIILNCMRTNKLELDETFELGYPKHLLLKEIEYFGLENEIKFVKPKIKDEDENEDDIVYNNPIPSLRVRKNRRNRNNNAPAPLNPNINATGAPLLRPNVTLRSSAKLYLFDFFNGVSSALIFVSRIMIILYSLNIQPFHSTNHYFIPHFISSIIRFDIKSIVSSWILFKNPPILLIRKDMKYITILSIIPLIVMKRKWSILRSIKLLFQFIIVIIALHFYDIIVSNNFIFWSFFILNLIFVLITRNRIPLYLFIDLWCFLFQTNYKSIRMMVGLIFISDISAPRKKKK